MPALIFGVVLMLAGCSSLELPGELLAAAGDKTYPGTPTDNYTRIARGVLGCWFAVERPLAKAYVFRANARPEAEGGRAEIVVYDKAPKGKLGLRAYSITLVPSGKGPAKGTAVAIRNHRLSEPIAARLEADVRRWAGGTAGCEPPPTQWGAANVRTQ